MLRKETGLAAMLVAAGSQTAWAATPYGGDGALANVLNSLFGRLDRAIGNLPAVRDYFAGLPQMFDFATVALLVGIVVAGVVAEQATRLVLARARLRVFERHAGESPLRAFLHAVGLDAVALFALWLAARAVAAQLGAPPAVPAVIAHQTLMGLIYWRGFNFVFRAFLRPNTPEGRIAPVDDAQASRLLVGLNLVIVLPVIGRHVLMFMMATGAPLSVVSTTVLLYVPVIAACLLLVVWHWRHDMGAWLAGMVNPKDTFHALKTAMAHGWWVAGLLFYAAAGLAAILAALTERESATRGLGAVESMLFLVLLFETLVHGKTRHLEMEAPTVTDVVAGCIKLAFRLIVVIVVVDAVVMSALGLMTPAEWEPHDRAMRLAAISAFAFYAFWRVVKYRMDRYIADNPLPVAGFVGDGDDGAPSTASRLRTVMPVLRITVGVALFILGGLLVLSELGVNVTPLIAGASVLGLAVSFGSQSLVRDIVSGVFFLAEDSFRMGEYIDSSKVKGTVEGFSVRSLRLRHQNGPLHIVPFGQILHITNFSRDWTTVKFNLSFAIDTDVELLRKTVKKIGIDMMAEPAFAKELLQPLKMQGIVDIKDGALIVRFKFTARPQNPALVQRAAIRRMYEAFPDKGIEFARPPGYGLYAPGLIPPPSAPMSPPPPPKPPAETPPARAAAAD
ncbi:MAG: mechanosensitive ion channel [Proteobacteria bacterium]|nr:mechanosensitive ion channel [Pseudomonadota bacterium]